MCSHEDITDIISSREEIMTKMYVGRDFLSVGSDKSSWVGD
jgi:hypothetical protein